MQLVEHFKDFRVRNALVEDLVRTDDLEAFKELHGIIGKDIYHRRLPVSLFNANSKQLFTFCVEKNLLPDSARYRVFVINFQKIRQTQHEQLMWIPILLPQDRIESQVAKYFGRVDYQLELSDEFIAYLLDYHPGLKFPSTVLTTFGHTTPQDQLKRYGLVRNPGSFWLHMCQALKDSYYSCTNMANLPPPAFPITSNRHAELRRRINAGFISDPVLYQKYKVWFDQIPAPTA